MFPILGAVYQEFFANAVNFDGTSDWLTVAPSDASDGKELTLSFWIKRGATGSSTGADGRIFSLDNTTLDRGELYFDTSDNLILALRNAAATEILLVQANNIITNTAWHHVAISIDLTNSSNRAFLIDDVDASPAWTTYSNDSIDYTTDTAWGIGATASGSGKFKGDLAEFWLNDARIDIASSNPFYDTGKPADIGLDGSGAGVQPMIYLRGLTDNWHVNKGTSGGCTENGALTKATTSPSD